MRRVLYVAHPVAPSEGEILDRLPGDSAIVGVSAWTKIYPEDVKRTTAAAALENVKRAGRWLQWLRREFRETTFIAPWMTSILTGDDDSDPAQREAGIVDCCATVERCDGIVLIGPRISSGMRRETEAGLTNGYDDSGVEPEQTFEVHDLTCYGWKDPSDVIVDGMLHVTFEEWIGQLPTLRRTP